MTSFCTASNPAPQALPRRKLFLQFRQPGGIGGDHRAGVEFRRLCRQFPQAVPGYQPGCVKAFRMCPQHRGGAAADRSGRTEDDDVFPLHFDSTIKVTGPSL
ncbi:MAG: hypothetical protein L6W00_22720 [Lentisphaeria bacterium]|nr:MAG: hypothetical protein L6W00_22720 [Lentisphaeria bacterium]